MRRVLPLVALASFALAGCGGGQTVSPAPQTVVGTFTLATATQGTTTQAAPASAGGAGATSGKSLFVAKGCGSCHTYKPAGTNGTIGPDLDKLAQYAQQAKQPLAAFTRTSIVNPKAYVQPGFQPVMPSFASLPKDQLTTLVDFLTKQQAPAPEAAPAPSKKKPSGSATGASGLAVFKASGCGSCHTFKAAGSKGKIGPDLDKLAQYAQQAKQPLVPFTKTSIVNPRAYVQPGFQPVMPTFASLPAAKLKALIAFLTKK